MKQVLCAGNITKTKQPIDFVLSESQRCISLGLSGFLHVNSKTRRFELHVEGRADLLSKLNPQNRYITERLFSSSLENPLFKSQFVGSISAGGTSKILVSNPYLPERESYDVFFQSNPCKDLLSSVLDPND